MINAVKTHSMTHVEVVNICITSYLKHVALSCALLIIDFNGECATAAIAIASMCRNWRKRYTGLSKVKGPARVKQLLSRKNDLGFECTLS